ncbi:MAG: GvpL/GvpF family gas vesicle protein [Candidatus Sericytochromatia bacterium]
MPTDAVWAYAVMEGGGADGPIGGLRGVAGEPVRLVTAAGLAAAVGTVGLEEFGEEAIRRHLEDLDWLAAKARAHDAVISAIARSVPVIPVRMATVYLGDNRVRQLLNARHDDFVAALNRVTGREELGVKAYADPKALGRRDDTADAGTGQRLSGTAYLMRRRQALISQEETYRIAGEEAQRIHACLMAQAVDGKRKPPTDRKLSGTDTWTVLNGTYLVEADRCDAFKAAVASLESEIPGIELEITGPWPPYSFAGDVVEQ